MNISESLQGPGATTTANRRAGEQRAQARRGAADVGVLERGHGRRRSGNVPKDAPGRVGKAATTSIAVTKGATGRRRDEVVGAGRPARIHRDGRVLASELLHYLRKLQPCHFAISDTRTLAALLHRSVARDALRRACFLRSGGADMRARSGDGAGVNCLKPVGRAMSGDACGDVRGCTVSRAACIRTHRRRTR